MRIRIGPVPFTKETKDRIPNNYGMEDHANQEIDYHVDAANQSYETALKVDGVPFMLWRKTQEGRRCTCKEGTGHTSNVDSRFEEYDQDNDQNNGDSITVRGSWDRQKVKPNAHGKELGVDIGRVKPDDGSDEQLIKDYPSIEQKEIDDFLQGPVDSRFLQSGDGITACGICFGTGFTNGYSLYSGVRVTFDSINISRVRGFRINKDKRPYVFEAPSEGSNIFIEWNWEVPTYYKDVAAIMLRNNLNPAEDLRILIRDLTSTEYTILTKNNLRDFSGKRVRVRVETGNSNRETIEFTHVEIILQYNDWPLTQVAPFQETTSQSTAEPVANNEFNLPPSIDKVDEGACITEMKYGKVWLITDVTDLQTAKHRILNWTVNARSLTSFDILSLLKLSINPGYGISFSGLNGDE